VVGYDPAADRYRVLDCTVAASAHECNHTLGWSAAGAVERWAAAAELELDPAFTTKDAAEELVKPLAAHNSLSVVETLGLAEADPALRAALGDPLVAGLVAPGLGKLLAPASADDRGAVDGPADPPLVAAATVRGHCPHFVRLSVPKNRTPDGGRGRSSSTRTRGSTSLWRSSARSRCSRTRSRRARATTTGSISSP
jgi:hypothetical protein